MGTSWDYCKGEECLACDVDCPNTPLGTYDRCWVGIGGGEGLTYACAYLPNGLGWFIASLPMFILPSITVIAYAWGKRRKRRIFRRYWYWTDLLMVFISSISITLIIAGLIIGNGETHHPSLFTGFIMLFIMITAFIISGLIRGFCPDDLIWCDGPGSWTTGKLPRRYSDASSSTYSGSSYSSSTYSGSSYSSSSCYSCSTCSGSVCSGSSYESCSCCMSKKCCSCSDCKSTSSRTFYTKSCSSYTSGGSYPPSFSSGSSRGPRSSSRGSRSRSPHSRRSSSRGSRKY